MVDDNVLALYYVYHINDDESEFDGHDFHYECGDHFD